MEGAQKGRRGGIVASGGIWGWVVSAAAGFGGGGLGVVGGYPAVVGTAAVGIYTHPRVFCFAEIAILLIALVAGGLGVTNVILYYIS